LKTALILHGTLGSPKGNWFAWLKAQLEAKGLQVWLPQLPHAEQPSLHEWSDFVHANCPFAINEETLIVGHSSGAILSLILAQQNDTPIGGVVAVSAFHDNSLQWEPNNHLFDVAFDWPAIQKNAHKLLFIHSDNDPYVPLGQAKYAADNCKAEIVVIPGQGHFNLEQSANYRTFPKLMEILEQHYV
jgi:predicted alpha/beta hydrolase family esterase